MKWAYVPFANHASFLKYSQKVSQRYQSSKTKLKMRLILKNLFLPKFISPLEK